MLFNNCYQRTWIVTINWVLIRQALALDLLVGIGGFLMASWSLGFHTIEKGLLGECRMYTSKGYVYSIDMNLGNAHLTISLENELDTRQPQHKVTWNGHSSHSENTISKELSALRVHNVHGGPDPS